MDINTKKKNVEKNKKRLNTEILSKCKTIKIRLWSWSICFASITQAKIDADELIIEINRLDVTFMDSALNKLMHFPKEITIPLTDRIHIPNRIHLPRGSSMLFSVHNYDMMRDWYFYTNDIDTVIASNDI